MCLNVKQYYGFGTGWVPVWRIAAHIESSHTFCEGLYEVGNNDVGHILCQHTGEEMRSPSDFCEEKLKYYITLWTRPGKKLELDFLMEGKKMFLI
jgi:hypothetical protein